MPDGQILYAITPEGLDRIASNIRQQVADGFTELKAFVIEKPMTRKEAADYLGIGLTALDNRIKRGDIPGKYVHKNGGTPYFLPSELHELIKKS